MKESAQAGPASQPRGRGSQGAPRQCWTQPQTSLGYRGLSPPPPPTSLATANLAQQDATPTIWGQ